MNRKIILNAAPLEDRAMPSGVPVLDAWLKASPGEFAHVLRLAF